MFVVTADQRGSRRTGDAVPTALTALSVPPIVGIVREFERTAGDEIQGVLDEPTGVITVVERLVRLGGWRVGVGVGAIDTPLPTSTRAGRGQAFVSARQAVEHARGAVGHVAVRAATDSRPLWRADTALALFGAVLSRRSALGWEAVDLITQGLSGAEAAERLGISPSAVSQRLRVAAYDEAQRAARLASDLLAEASRC